LAYFNWPNLAVNSAVIHIQDRLLIHPDERALMAILFRYEAPALADVAGAGARRDGEH
jgi:hypothetical protein